MPARANGEPASVDVLTGLPMLPVVIERTRAIIKERGDALILYVSFDRYSTLEEIYGWEKLDAVLGVTAAALREVLDGEGLRRARATVCFAGDDDFVILDVPAPSESVPSENQISELVSRLHEGIIHRIETALGEDIAALVGVFVGRARVVVNPKLRLERQIYRGIREAAAAAQNIEERERDARVADLRASLRDGAVYIEYHPIVVAHTGEIFGYEALARGAMHSLRSPDVMFEVAAGANLIWELSVLCRTRALEGMKTRLRATDLLFLNIDPHDFTDPNFSQLMEAEERRRVVIEITERAAIKDYARIRGLLREFRDVGFRFAVDDVGSGYAGLGSIANLEPDFIKLDMSLINCIDTNFIKQNLVETMVNFANDQGAKVIAEGVERAEEFETVKRLGVHLIQGFYLHRREGGVLRPSVGIPIYGATRE